MSNPWSGRAVESVAAKAGGTSEPIPTPIYASVRTVAEELLLTLRRSGRTVPSSGFSAAVTDVLSRARQAGLILRGITANDLPVLQDVLSTSSLRRSPVRSAPMTYGAPTSLRSE
jgi:hypothetical protein